MVPSLVRAALHTIGHELRFRFVSRGHWGQGISTKLEVVRYSNDSYIIGLLNVAKTHLCRIALSLYCSRYSHVSVTGISHCLFVRGGVTDFGRKRIPDAHTEEKKAEGVSEFSGYQGPGSGAKIIRAGHDCPAIFLSRPWSPVRKQSRNYFGNAGWAVFPVTPAGSAAM